MTSEQEAQQAPSTHYHAWWCCDHYHRLVGSPAAPWSEADPVFQATRVPHRHARNGEVAVIEWAGLHHRCDGTAVVGG